MKKNCCQWCVIWYECYKNEEPLRNSQKTTNLSKEQYDQLLDMLHYFKNSSTHNDAQTSGAVKFVGTITYISSINFDKLSYGCFKEKTD